MTEAEELKQCFHQCMPFFIALGDEIRLTIVEALTEAASRRCGGDYSMENLSLHGLKCQRNYRIYQPVPSCSIPPLKNTEGRGADFCETGGDLQLLLSLHLPGHFKPDRPQAQAPVLPEYERRTLTFRFYYIYFLSAIHTKANRR